MSPLTEAGILLAYAALVVGSYAFAWRCSNHAMDEVRKLTAAFNDLKVTLADRLARVETKLGIDNPGEEKE